MTEHEQDAPHAGTTGGKPHHYRRLLVMTALSFIAMYILMYAMVNRLANVYPNFNQFYMAGLMAASMVIIELLVMGRMYDNRNLNVLLIAVSVVALAGFFALIQEQAAISDRQFLKSMIPHHAGAVLMCGEAPITDPEIRKLCEEITLSQQKEIDWMKRKLAELDR